MGEKALLNYINQYVTLSSQEELIISSNIHYRKYKKGQYIVQQGDICKYESFILSGCLKTYFVDQEGQEHVVMFAVEDWWTADLGSFITKTPSDYNVQCLEDTELLQFSYETLENLYIQVPKLERFFRIIIQKAYVSLEKRVIRNFSLPAKDRYIIFKEQYPAIEQRVPQYLVASYLGITKEFLSKIKKELLKRKSK